jgi:hypothetical protein
MLFGAAMLVLGSCNSQGLSGGGGTPGDGGTGGCQDGQLNCEGNALQTCSEGVFTTEYTCAADKTCDNSLGCVDCLPGSTICANNNTEVHSCNPDGTIGALQMTCPFGQACLNGGCVDACEVAASQFVYVVDQNNNFLSFQPSIDTDPSALQLIGKLNCSTTGATPFSMAVDRTARAWVLYSDGNIYWVNPQDASCMPSGYTTDQMGFNVFGMGFTSDSVGSNTEHLFVANGPGFSNLGLASIDPTTLMLTKVAALPASSPGSPEMTGTGNAQLFGYFPSASANQLIAQIDKTTGQFDVMYSVPPLPKSPNDWAFAAWGGRFYQFVTTNGQNVIYRYDPTTNMNIIVQQNTPYPIDGAGVSTCAPYTTG